MSEQRADTAIYWTWNGFIWKTRNPSNIIDPFFKIY